jgi:hypothetical protein
VTRTCNPATQEAGMRRIAVGGQSQEKVKETPSQQTSPRGWSAHAAWEA